eukprot:TRINITY_DN3131_c0_g1_i3.p1 TRINITY_DN3131_c0_g1~~TRINITY_DN3131_c0_g1_i3.p1  ORF type:complete len:252 (+),score=62.48 TRINITY_DN3131_c0_g1_i3:63-818(+)
MAMQAFTGGAALPHQMAEPSLRLRSRNIERPPASFEGFLPLFATGSAAVAAAALSSTRKSARRQVVCLAAAEAVTEGVIEEDPLPPFDPSKQIGATAPLGFFDPLGFCKVGDYETFHNLRCAEIKHGRVAMMAAAGTVFSHYVKFPGFESTPAGLGALTDGVGILGFVALMCVAAFLESVYWKDDLSKEPGNFGDPAGWIYKLPIVGEGGSYSDEMRNKEINNGRMAMFSILGILVAEVATGKDGVQQFGL